MTSSKKDPLIGRIVRIHDDARDGKKNKPHPYAGESGRIIGKPPGGRSYWVQCGPSQVSVPMDAFEVLGVTATTATEESTLPLTALAPSRTNRPVVEDEALHDMAATMKLYGVLQPLLVRKLPPERLQDTFESLETRKATHEIIAGERRWAAARIAGLRSVPVLHKDADAPAALTMQLIENLHREGLNPLDEARGIQRLIEEHNMSHEAVGEALRKGRSHVYETLRLMELPADAQAALRAGTLKRSVALLVAQRPTPALQQEFLKKVLTSGPEGGPLSYRSAKDLAQRQYMTDLAHAPFSLADANLLPQAGACTTCPKRTGANPELWDKAGTDVCTDTACFADKKEAHHDRLKSEAQAKGRKIITGREAREIMPTDNATPAGYLLLDKPKKGQSEPMRQVLGQDVPQSSVVLIETPSGGLVEAVAVRAAGDALKAKAASSKGDQKSTEPTKDELEAEYQRRWRRAAITHVIETLKNETPFDAELPALVAKHYILAEAREADEALVRSIFELPERYTDAELERAASQAAEASPRAAIIALMMLAATVDAEPLFDRPADEAKYLDAVAQAAGVDISRFKLAAQEEMKAEAAERAAQAGGPTDKAKPVLKHKGKGKTPDGPAKASPAEVMASIAQAMQATSDAPQFTPGQQVTIKCNLKDMNGRLVMTAGASATIVRALGDRSWVVSLPDPWPFPGTAPEDRRQIEITADYTELEVAA